VPSISRPSRIFSFADWSRTRPKEPPPGDRLDAQIANLIDAIHSTQLALADIRRDDGKLINASVALEQLAPAVEQHFTKDVRSSTLANAVRAEGGAAVTAASEQSAQLFAQDAEAAAISAARFLSAANTAQKIVEAHTGRVETLSDTVEAETIEAQDWANYSHAQADNAIAAKDEALQWAEYLAGPVVDSEDAPAYIADSAFPHGLYYQPVEGYGGVAGLWSAKWWAVYAAQLVGAWNFYYLGAWPAPPMPGNANPATGVKVPNPLAVGSFYYDTTTGQLYVWDGSAWITPFGLAPGYQNQFVYQATAGQTTFSGPDYNGKTPVVGTSPSDVHLNGVRLVHGIDYVIVGDALELENIVPSINSVLQWDLLVSSDKLIPGVVFAFKCTLAPAPDGVTTHFTLTYPNPSSGTQPVNATSNAQMLVSVDGIVQEPGVDYTAAGNTLIMATAPTADAHFWASWLANATLTS
jgi:hypothetical protein